jgi:hypothetical protein
MQRHYIVAVARIHVVLDLLGGGVGDDGADACLDLKDDLVRVADRKVPGRGFARASAR